MREKSSPIKYTIKQVNKYLTKEQATRYFYFKKKKNYKKGYNSLNSFLDEERVEWAYLIHRLFISTDEKYKNYRKEYKKANSKAIIAVSKKWIENNRDLHREASKKSVKKGVDNLNLTYIRNILRALFPEIKAKYSTNKTDVKTLYIYEIKRMMVISSRLANNINPIKTKEQMKDLKSNVKKLNSSINEDIANMSTLASIMLDAMTRFDKAEITRAQLMTYMHAGNTTFKTIFAKYQMEQAMITQEAIEIPVEI